MSSKRILLITPAPPGSRHGNRNTATRWARMLRAGGHRVDIATSVEEIRIGHDLMIALHARRSAEAIAQWKSRPQRPLILALTGTDLYRDIRSDASAQRSMALADRMIVLQDQGLLELSAPLRAKTTVIHQSVRAVKRADPPLSYTLFTVIGHLREEKDPLRAALALETLSPDARVKVVQLGGVMSEPLASEAREISAREPRYRWLGELAHGDAMRWLARSHAMVISSRMEGGAHVVSEAIACGVPVLASDIPGNTGLLGADYPGLYPLEDAQALAALMQRVANDRRFVLALERAVSKRRHLTDPAAEADAINRLCETVLNANTA